MAEKTQFNLERNGVPFTVFADNAETADQLLDESLANRPMMLPAKAHALGLDFDFDTNMVRDRTAGEAFAIGAGKSVNDALEFMSDIFDPDELTAMEINRRKNEEDAYRILDEQGIADDFGEFAGNVGMLMLFTKGAAATLAMRTLKGAGKAGFTLAKMASGFGLVGAAGRQFIKIASKKKISAATMTQAATHPTGRAAIKALAQTKDPKTVEVLVNTISRQANKRVQAAQIRANRILRAQDKGQAGNATRTLANIEQGQGAVQVAGQAGARTSATQTVAQEGLKDAAKGSLNVAKSAAKPVETAAQRAELIKGIGFKKPGQGNPTSEAASRQALRNLIDRG